MKHGSSLLIWYFLLMFLLSGITLAEEKFLSAPLINLDKIQSFEVLNEDNESISNSSIKEKIQKINACCLIGLDKITAKSSKIHKLDEIKNLVH